MRTISAIMLAQRVSEKEANKSVEKTKVSESKDTNNKRG